MQRAILAKDGPDDIDHVLRTAVLSASGAGMDALVLESCIACKAALPDAYSVLCGEQLKSLPRAYPSDSQLLALVRTTVAVLPSDPD